MTYPESESGCPYETIGKLKDELDRLRGDNENLHQQLDAVSEAHNTIALEATRLRAENADLLQAGKIYVSELNRITAENERLREYLRWIGHEAPDPPQETEGPKPIS